MKKALLYGLSAALLLASLTACNKSQADQPTEPDPTPTPSAVQTEPVETPEPEETTSPVEPIALVSMTDEVLIGHFEAAYSKGRIFESLGVEKEEVLQEELNDLAFMQEISDHLAWPDDLEAQYLAWREANYPQEPEAAKAPSSNPQTQPSINNQAQSVSNQTGGNTGSTTQTNTGTQQTGPGGATIVHDPSSDYISTSGSLATGGQRAPDEVITSEDMGYAPIDPSKIIYGGN